jgi:exopolyphosphatase/guanosine-5'-triphosphate,3'-diphosphate pyrophosphatase
MIWRTQKTPEIVAAVDLGSNSFHMIVARLQNGELNVIDRMREMVRLAAGLDKKRRITAEARERALGCLERFGQRLRDMPPGSVRAVGTNTLRSARDSEDFLQAAEQALGHTIEIISGVEEARLIYLGVARSLADDTGRRLVMDIGGGSTELIVGERFKPIHMDSLYMGCVSMSREFFADGTITRKRINRADIAARMELEPVEAIYRGMGWTEAIGASGTIRAVAAVVHLARWADGVITAASLDRLVDALATAGHVDKLTLPGLDPERAPVFPGGAIILRAAFDALGIDKMQVADGALREGLLYDLLGRIRHEDVRSNSVNALATRYHVDAAQAQRVRDTALQCLDQTAETWGLAEEWPEQMLAWAAQLHEIGLDIAHSKYHKHGAYVVENTDLLGFSRQEQKLLAALVRGHRRKLPVTVIRTFPGKLFAAVQYLTVLLRLSVLLHRSRSPDPVADFTLQARKDGLVVEFPAGWLEAHPLTRADLEEEAVFLAAAGFSLTIA